MKLKFCLPLFVIITAIVNAQGPYLRDQAWFPHCNFIPIRLAME